MIEYTLTFYSSKNPVVVDCATMGFNGKFMVFRDHYGDTVAAYKIDDVKSYESKGKRSHAYAMPLDEL